MIEKKRPWTKQQLTSTMIPYLSILMMVQLLWRRGQQQWRDGHCSCERLAETTRTFFCEKCASKLCMGVYVQNVQAKIIATSSRPQVQETARVIEKHVQHHWQQQLTSTMIPYLSVQMMVQSLWRRGQQQKRDGYNSHGRLAATTRTFFCEQ